MITNLLTADRLVPGQAGRIVELRTAEALRRRLADLGLIPGAVLLRRQSAPAGSPIAFELQGMVLALRRADAARIVVAEIGTPWSV